jgi:hypothetical protein
VIYYLPYTISSTIADILLQRVPIDASPPDLQNIQDASQSPIPSSLPSSIDLTGKVHKTSPFPVAGGAFSDVWQGIYNGTTVAIKVPRIVVVTPEKLRKVS